MDRAGFLEYLGTAERKTVEFLRRSDVPEFFRPSVARHTACCYVERSAKRLRPAVLLMAAGCMGGPRREEQAVPAAAGVELFHTWTLVHDDIIDNDRLRRGKPTAHIEARDFACRTLGVSRDAAPEFGRNVAMLAGDLQHGWSVSAFADCALDTAVDPAIVLRIIRCLQSYVLGNLICGETLDVQYSVTGAVTTSDLSDQAIEEMLRLKTGILYEFAGWAGAVIGSGHYVPIDCRQPSSEADRAILALCAFTGNCGTAFQLQDDILGVVGDQAELGKPVGSDIREGKQTVIVCEALRRASPAQQSRILDVLGNRNATRGEIDEVTALFRDLGGIAHASERARRYIEMAFDSFDQIPKGPYRDLLRCWADFMIDREF